MSNSRKVYIISDPEHYSKAYNAYENLSSKYDEFSNWLEYFFPSAVVDKLHPGELTLRMLGIGSGAGEAESVMISHFLKTFHRIENTVIEPSVERLLQYKAMVTQESHLKVVDFTWKNQTVEEYQKMRRQLDDKPQGFHFISALHSLYDIDDPSDVIHFMYDSLESGGIMMVVLTAVDSGFGELRSRFPILATNESHLLNGHIKSTLDGMNVSHYSFYGGGFVDITSCYDDRSIESNLALDFLTNIVNFREWASPILEKEILDFMKNSCSKIGSEGQILFRDRWEAVLAIKP